MIAVALPFVLLAARRVQARPAGTVSSVLGRLKTRRQRAGAPRVRDRGARAGPAPPLADRRTGPDATGADFAPAPEPTPDAAPEPVGMGVGRDGCDGYRPVTPDGVLPQADCEGWRPARLDGQAG
ncbi:hypothetical protein ACN28C_29050 [Plantactinospora sp. WMMC1484]|uniref:hypothetical protein n=1 Tax=Plantactinospora sp. WMMC1484 TaxID=3404122 RepID=UPI003BF5092E